MGSSSRAICLVENGLQPFYKWRDEGTLLRIFKVLNEDDDMENLSLDSTVVKVHPHSAGLKGTVNSENHQFISTSRGGKSTKIHIMWWTILEIPFTFSSRMKIMPFLRNPMHEPLALRFGTQ